MCRPVLRHHTARVVADIGCGPGHITRFLSARLERVVGLDLSPAMIAAARQSNPGLPFAVASMAEAAIPRRRLGRRGGDVLDHPFRPRGPSPGIRRVRPHPLHGRPAADVLSCRGPGLAPGDVNHLSTFLGHSVDMEGDFLNPVVITRDLVANGFRVEARLDREPIAGIEFASRRCYILARRAVRSSHGPRA